MAFIAVAILVIYVNEYMNYCYEKAAHKGLDYGKDQLKPPILTMGLCGSSIVRAPFHGFMVSYGDRRCRLPNPQVLKGVLPQRRCGGER